MRLRLTILGKGSPVLCSDGRKTMCAAGVSDDLGLVRLYPFNVQTEAKVWDVVEVEVDRGEDSRLESWKIVQSRMRFRDQSSLVRIIGNVSDRSTKVALLDECVLKSGEVTPIDYLNDNRMSLAVIRPEKMSGYLDFNTAKKRQVTPFDDYQNWVWTQDEYEYTPRIRWISVQGSEHDQKVVAHEFFVGIQRFPNNPNAIFDNAQLYNPDFAKWLLIGNMNNYRTSWVVVHVHRTKVLDVGFILPSCIRPNGASEEWPYLRQEGVNAKRVVPHWDLFTSITCDT